jgi:hypothetical protein
VYSGTARQIDWTADIPGGSSLTVKVRSSSSGVWVPVAKPGALPFEGEPTGYLGVEVMFTRPEGGQSPILYDFTITDQATELQASCSCVLGPNPNGKITGQATNGFFTLVGDGNCAVKFYVVDDVTGHAFGPYPNGTNFKWTEAVGADPEEKPGRYVVICASSFNVIVASKLHFTNSFLYCNHPVVLSVTC